MTIEFSKQALRIFEQIKHTDITKMNFGEPVMIQKSQEIEIS
jgi:hypothetical protein